MSRLIRQYNQNRELVIAIVIVIALILIVIYTLNSIIAKDQERKLSEMSNLANNTHNDKTSISQSDTSAITGEKVENNETNVEIIKQFIEYCNEGKYELAYNMLSKECQQEVFPSLERFKTVYVDRIFNIKRMYTLKNWYSSGNYDTYFVRYTEDVLATGNVNTENNVSDYITVFRDKGKNYLNINNFIGYFDINKNKTAKGISVTVNKMYMYMDYTILDFTVKNTSNNIISIDTKEEQDTMYIYDANNLRYTAFLNEIADELLQARVNMQTNLKIKFNKMYNPESRTIVGLKLKDVVLNYENYIEGAEEKNSIELDIEI